MKFAYQSPAMSDNFIPGIYNYCDRWCERCTFTSCCAVYEDESDFTPEERDIANKAFWERLGKNFLKAQELLQKAAEHIGLELENLSDEPEEVQQKKERIKKKSPSVRINTNQASMDHLGLI